MDGGRFDEALATFNPARERGNTHPAARFVAEVAERARVAPSSRHVATQVAEDAAAPTFSAPACFATAAGDGGGGGGGSFVDRIADATLPPCHLRWGFARDGRAPAPQMEPVYAAPAAPGSPLRAWLEELMVSSARLSESPRSPGSPFSPFSSSTRGALQHASAAPAAGADGRDALIVGFPASSSTR